MKPFLVGFAVGVALLGAAVGWMWAENRRALRRAGR